MDTEFEEIALEQRDRAAAGPVSGPAAEAEAAPSCDQTRPRGRPWVKGQSGNPAGRPRRLHAPSAAVDYVIGRRSIRIARKVRDLLLSGDRAMLRLWYQDVAAARRAAPEAAGMPLAEDRARLRTLRQDLEEAVARGAISKEQADALVRIVNTVMGLL